MCGVDVGGGQRRSPDLPPGFGKCKEQLSFQAPLCLIPTPSRAQPTSYPLMLLLDALFCMPEPLYKSTQVQ